MKKKATKITKGVKPRISKKQIRPKYFWPGFGIFLLLLSALIIGVIALTSGEQFRNMGSAYAGDSCVLPEGGGIAASNTCGCQIGIKGAGALAYCKDGAIHYNPEICTPRCAPILATPTPAPVGASCGDSIDNDSQCNNRPVGFDCTAGATGDKSECVQDSDSYGSWCTCKVTQQATKVSCGTQGISDSYCSERNVDDSCGNTSDSATCKVILASATDGGCRCVKSNGEILRPIATPTPTWVPVISNDCNDLSFLTREQLPDPRCENVQVGQSCNVDVPGYETACLVKYSSRQLPYCACVLTQRSAVQSTNTNVSPTQRSVSPSQNQPSAESPLPSTKVLVQASPTQPEPKSRLEKPSLPNPSQRITETSTPIIVVIWQRILRFFGR